MINWPALNWRRIIADARSSTSCDVKRRKRSTWRMYHVHTRLAGKAMGGTLTYRPSPPSRESCLSHARSGTWLEPASLVPEVTSFAFAPALHPPDDAPRAAAWFAFRGDRLLVRTDGERAALVEFAELSALGADFEAGH